MTQRKQSLTSLGVLSKAKPISTTATGLVYTPVDKTESNKNAAWFWKNKDGTVNLYDIDDRFLLTLVNYTLRRDVQNYINWHRHMVFGSVTQLDVATAAYSKLASDLRFSPSSNLDRDSLLDYRNAQTVLHAAAMIAHKQLEEYEWYESHRALRVELDRMWSSDGNYVPVAEYRDKRDAAFFVPGGHSVFCVLFCEAKWRGLIGDEKLNEFYAAAVKGEYVS